VNCASIKGSNFFARWDVGWDIEVHWNRWCVTSAPSSCLAQALATGSYTKKVSLGCAGATCVGYPDSQSDVVMDGRGDSSDLVVRGMGAGASAASLWGGVGGSCSVSATQAPNVQCAPLGYASNSSHHEVASSYSKVASPDCRCFSDSYTFGLATGWGVTIRNYVMVDQGGPDMIYYARHHYFFDFISSSYSRPCGGRGPVQTGPTLLPDDLPTLVGVRFDSLNLTAKRADGLADSSVLQGVYAWYSDGTSTRLGFYGGDSYKPSATPTGLGVNADTTYKFVFSGNNYTSFKDESSIDTFTSFDGEINRDGKVTWADRHAMVASIGSVIGESGYNARADFDLTGKINETDYKGYVEVFTKSKACKGDYNADGVVNNADLEKFAADFSAGRLNADYNGDLVLNQTDFDKFVAAWNAGC
jgi:hypothetical protein